MIIYNDAAHTYTGLEGKIKDKKFTSVSHVIHDFEPKKNWKEIAEKYVAVRTPKKVISDLATKQNKTVEEVLKILNGREVNWEFVAEMWKNNNKEACDYGHDIHLKEEMVFKEMQEDGLQVFTNPVLNDIRISLPLDNLQNGVYSELILWDENSLICGTSDIVEVSGKKVEVRDFKTNKELKFEGFRGECMLGPVKHIPNSNFWHYTLQLSIYAYMLELRGYEVGKLILHYTRENKDFELNYLKLECQNIFKLYKAKQNPLIKPIEKPKSNEFNINDYL